MTGLVTRYRKSDATLAALAVANRLDQIGHNFSMYVYDWRNAHIDPAYDNRMHRQSFQQWLKKIKHIVWTAPVDPYFIHTARKSGIRSTLYTSWDQLVPYDEHVLSEYAHVLVPSALQAVKVREKFHSKCVAVMPYDPGIPFTIKANLPSKPDEINIFISLYGKQLSRIDFSALLVLGGLMHDDSRVKITVGCSRGLALYSTRELKRLTKRYPDRWRVLWDCSWPEQVMQMGLHDLTIWPARWDGFGIVGLTSLAMGTPVIAWDIAPINEYLRAGRNSLLVNTEVEYNWLGMPRAKPNYAELDHILRWLLDTPDALKELRLHTAETLDERRDDFRKGWNAVLPMLV